MGDVVHLIDDDEAMRESLQFLLAVNGLPSIVHESADAFLAANPDRVGCIVTDVRMPGMTGIELAHRLHALGRRWPIIVMTGHGDVRLAVEAMKAGVSDFLEKPFDDQAMLVAVRNALSGSTDQKSAAARQEAEARLSTLSPRERDVLAGVVEGKLNKVIAFDLEISPRTVEIYRANLMAKTGARNMAELMRIALAAGL